MMPSVPLKTSSRIGVDRNHRFLHVTAVYLFVMPREEIQTMSDFLYDWETKENSSSVQEY